MEMFGSQYEDMLPSSDVIHTKRKTTYRTVSPRQAKIEICPSRFVRSEACCAPARSPMDQSRYTLLECVNAENATGQKNTIAATAQPMLVLGGVEL